MNDDQRTDLIRAKQATIDRLRGELEQSDKALATATNAHLRNGEKDVEIARLRGEVERHRQDMIEAAGELLVPVPEPGTDMAKMLIANRQLQADLTALRSRLPQTKDGVRKTADGVPITECVIVFDAGGNAYQIEWLYSTRAAAEAARGEE